MSERIQSQADADYRWRRREEDRRRWSLDLDTAAEQWRRWGLDPEEDPRADDFRGKR